MKAWLSCLCKANRINFSDFKAEDELFIDDDHVSPLLTSSVYNSSRPVWGRAVLFSMNSLDDVVQSWCMLSDIFSSLLL